MNIKSNVSSISKYEIEVIKTARNYAYVYGVGLIFITGKNGEAISWDCSNTVAAKKLLDDLGIREIK